MSDRTPPTDTLAGLEQRIQELAEAAARRKRVLVAAGVVVALLTAAYLGFAWQQIRSQLDAPTLVAAAEMRAQPLLDRPASSWAEELEAQAPALLDAAAAAAMQAPEQLSERVLGYVDAAVAERMPDLENRFEELAAALVDQAAEAAGDGFKEGQMSDEEAEAVVTAIADQFDASLREKVDALYDDYTGVSGELIDRLDKLATGENLSEKEALHRELITSFLALLQRVQAKG
ncbi:hypothetical protein [Phycisphaera mikurensis]|uniref:Uncharacterized protein n=1 Tax=Phycisphaera mikurensis (strain NBRC 102666 / KCTC 22515 / FYK2301M01) TaxID=1142394 RepID=I0IB82_PHYMF|nr:hypothetical protein [Phycisphaera mikurensis]MBB6443018.1 hypothetical protein [Phycisphaera mikurensis]BAM02520.1 hypothetical protein PSMK_03610 [Phycisphaera mikurensis NBRC 102666]